MQYKTELHAHTREVSPCADLTAPEVAERFLAAGYTSLVVTNHYCDYVVDNAGESWEEKMDYYLLPYRKMQEYAKGRLNVLLGLELRFLENFNDYLVYGVDEQFLHDYPDLHKMSLKTFAPFAKEHGLLVIQAHPFRNRMTVMNPKLLDGVEVFNGHKGHDSRNPVADMWAKRYGLLRASGSDFHHPDSEESGGILTEQPITSVSQLVETLRTGNCILHCSGTAAALDGMVDMPAKYD
ncbi:MAG: hypothetical protein IJF33_01835 [Clostridia bacterium]|nr:hypothetical protein [Clostridia bacterium]